MLGALFGSKSTETTEARGPDPEPTEASPTPSATSCGNDGYKARWMKATRRLRELEQKEAKGETLTAEERQERTNMQEMAQDIERILTMQGADVAAVLGDGLEADVVSEAAPDTPDAPDAPSVGDALSTATTDAAAEGADDGSLISSETVAQVATAAVGVAAVAAGMASGSVSMSVPVGPAFVNLGMPLGGSNHTHEEAPAPAPTEQPTEQPTPQPTDAAASATLTDVEPHQPNRRSLTQVADIGAKNVTPKRPDEQEAQTKLDRAKRRLRDIETQLRTATGPRREELVAEGWTLAHETIPPLEQIHRNYLSRVQERGVAREQFFRSYKGTNRSEEEFEWFLDWSQNAEERSEPRYSIGYSGEEQVREFAWMRRFKALKKALIKYIKDNPDEVLNDATVETVESEYLPPPDYPRQLREIEAKLAELRAKLEGTTGNARRDLETEIVSWVNAESLLRSFLDLPTQFQPNAYDGSGAGPSSEAGPPMEPPPPVEPPAADAPPAPPGYPYNERNMEARADRADRARSRAERSDSRPPPVARERSEKADPAPEGPGPSSRQTRRDRRRPLTYLEEMEYEKKRLAAAKKNKAAVPDADDAYSPEERGDELVDDPMGENEARQAEELQRLREQYREANKDNKLVKESDEDDTDSEEETRNVRAAEQRRQERARNRDFQAALADHTLLLQEIEAKLDTAPQAMAAALTDAMQSAAVQAQEVATTAAALATDEALQRWEDEAGDRAMQSIHKSVAALPVDETLKSHMVGVATRLESRFSDVTTHALASHNADVAFKMNAMKQDIEAMRLAVRDCTMAAQTMATYGGFTKRAVSPQKMTESAMHALPTTLPTHVPAAPSTATAPRRRSDRHL